MKASEIIRRSIALFLLVVMPIREILGRYESREITTTSGLGIVPTILVLIISLLALSFLLGQFKELLKKEPFGWLAIMTFGIVLLVSLFGAWFILNEVTKAAQANLEAFIATFDYHAETLRGAMTWIGLGIGWAMFNKLITTTGQELLKRLYEFIFKVEETE